MRINRFARKTLNLILVVAMCLCITIARPTYLYAGPCADAANATYSDAIEACEAGLADATAAWEAALDAFDQACLDANASWEAAFGACVATLNAAILPWDIWLEETHNEIDEWADDADEACDAISDAGERLACKAAVVVAKEALREAAHVAWIAGTDSYFDEFNDCSDDAWAGYTALMDAADAAKFAAEDAYTAAYSGDYAICMATAGYAWGDALAACPDPDE